MNCPFNTEQLNQLKAFVLMCKMKPHILQHPSLDFFKEYIVSMGGNIPVSAFKPEPTPDEQVPKTETQAEPQVSPSDESEPESEVELDLEGVIEGDVVDENQEMGDSSKEATEEEIDQSDEKRSEAVKHFSEQEYEQAIKSYTEAILLYPMSALLFAKRGQVFLKLNKPNACIKDCTHALELNCDSSASYKFRGRAHRLLGNFDKAAADLRESCKIDYDEQAQEWLTEVTPNAEKLRAHALNVKRREEEKEHKEKLKRHQQAKEAHASASQATPGTDGQAFGDKKFEGEPFNLNDPMGIFNDPELILAFQDPEVAAAFNDATANPANIFKYQNNPKVANILNKLATKVGSGGAPGFAPPPSEESPNSQPSNDDVGLD